MAKKIKNERCPLQKECEKSCMHVGTELNCDYYRNNGIGYNTIPDQEELRNKLDALKSQKDFEDEIANLPDEEEKTTAMNEAKLVYISVDKLEPHPDNPRKELGDLTELAESIKSKGVMQNLTVVPFKSRTNPKFNGAGRYTVVIGHRRLGAAKLAGLTELPCVITEMSEQEQIATMLLENMQRSDLTVYEQAQGFQMMIDFGESVESIAEKTGFSQSTVRRRLKMAELNQDTLKKVSERQLSLADFDRLSEIEDMKERNYVLKQIGTNNFENELAKAISEQKRKANQRRWHEELEKYNATEIPEKDKWDRDKYICLLNCYITDDPVEKLKERFDGEGPFYYCMDRWGTVYLRKRKTQAKIDEAMAVQMELEQRKEKSKQISAALEDAFERAYGLRLNFIKGVSESTAKKHIADIARFMVAIGYSQYSVDFESDIFADLLKLQVPKDSEDPDCDDEEAAEKVFADAAANSPHYALLVTAYVQSNDSKHSNCYDWNCYYKKCGDLDRLYDFLTALGYEISDEERELLTGESELYARPTPPADSVSACG